MTIELGGLKIPTNFRSYPSPNPPPASIGSSDLIQELILATTIYAGNGKVKISPAGICIIGDADSMSNAMLRFVSTSSQCTGSTGVAYIFQHEGDFGMTCDGVLQLTGGEGIEAILGTGDFLINGTGTLILPSTTSDPTGKPDGSVYYNSSTKKNRQKLNGVWGDVGSGSSSFDATATIHNTARVAGTVYQNTSGKVRTVVVSVKRTGASHTLIGRIGSSYPPSNIVAQALCSVEYSPITFIVPKDYYYKIDALSSPYDAYLWTEYDLG